jgi:hypothetical protein
MLSSGLEVSNVQFKITKNIQPYTAVLLQQFYFSSSTSAVLLQQFYFSSSTSAVLLQQFYFSSSTSAVLLQTEKQNQQYRRSNNGPERASHHTI